MAIYRGNTQLDGSINNVATTIDNSSTNSEVAGAKAVYDAIPKTFTGTDGTADGTTGIVPAPLTTDADKFLKSDGTWGEAGGGFTPLSGNIYMKSIADGNYEVAQGSKIYWKYSDSTQYLNVSYGKGRLFVSNAEISDMFAMTTYKICTWYLFRGDNGGGKAYEGVTYRESYGSVGTTVPGEGYQELLNTTRIKNNLTTSSNNANYALSAYQGYVLNNKIGDVETVLQTLNSGSGV